MGPLVRDMVGGRQFFGPTRPDDECVDDVRQAIYTRVDPEPWKDNGGLIGTAWYLNGWLFVTRTEQAHAGIARLLLTLAHG